MLKFILGVVEYNKTMSYIVQDTTTLEIRTISQYEAGGCIPVDLRYCERCNLLTLFHGSKTGIKGRISPSSRINCDFGKGFYLGESVWQTSNLVKDYGNSIEYVMFLDKSSLSFYSLDGNMTFWALYIAYNRGYLKQYAARKHVRIPEKLIITCNTVSSNDVIFGYIGDDKMKMAFEAFVTDKIPLEYLTYALGYVNLGHQYKLNTKKACDSILAYTEINKEFRNDYIDMSKLVDTLMCGIKSGIFLKDVFNIWR